MITVIITSILIGLIFAPLGCLVLWKKYVYFGDGLAHASMLAGAFSLIAGVPILYAGIINTVIFSITIYKLKDQTGNNAAIGLTSSIMISLALILSYFYPGKLEITNLLFGDIVSANNEDIIILSGLLLIVIIFFIITYRYFIMIIISKDVASSRGIKVNILELLFLGILSFSILYTIKIVGALLVTSIILIPALTSRIIANSPLSMIGFAIIFALLMNLIGSLLSFYADVPFAPVIILSGGVMYLATLVIKTIVK